MKLPLWAKYTAQDRVGRVWAFSVKPELREHRLPTSGKVIQYWDIPNGEKCMMVRFGSVPEDFTKTLQKVGEQ